MILSIRDETDEREMKQDLGINQSIFMPTYIKTEDVESFARSLIKDSRHLKSAMKEMSIQEEDEFIKRIVEWNLNIVTF